MALWYCWTNETGFCNQVKRAQTGKIWPCPACCGWTTKRRASELHRMRDANIRANIQRYRLLQRELSQTGGE